MAWSTREIAELAGTSLRAVRHYHEVGLLAEPERLPNGYKQYGVTHLIRVLRVKRLVELGFSLSEIADMGAEDDHPEEALRSRDAELAAAIERLERIRAELGTLLRQSVPTDLPPELAPALRDEDLGGADRSFIVVMARVMGPTGLRAYAEMLRDRPPDPIAGAFDDLPADADESSRAAMAARLVPHLRELMANHPDMADLSDAPLGKGFAIESIAKAMAELYNPAQIDVLRRAGAQLQRD